MACFTKKELQDQYESLLNEGIDKYEAAQQILSAEYERISSNANQIRQSIGLAEKTFTPNKIDIKSIESKYNIQIEKVRKDFESKKAKETEQKVPESGTDSKNALPDVPNQPSQVKPDETNKNEGKEQINNTSIDEAREMFGMEQLNSSKITIEDIIKEAHQKHITPSVLDSGSYVRENNIVASVMRGKPLDAAEQYALGNLISKMKKEYRRTEEHIKEAESKKQDSSQLHNKLNETKEILQNATEALRKAGTIAGRALAIRKEFLDFNMFDEANLISDFKTNMERSNFAMTENDETFISKTANGIFFKQEEVDIQLQKEQEIIQKNKEIAAQNAFAEMNKRKEHIKTSPKLSEALANLDNVLKGKIC